MTEFPNTEINSAAHSIVEQTQGDMTIEHAVDDVAKRNQWLEAALNDPGRTLPEVTLKPRDSKRIIIDFPDVQMATNYTPPATETALLAIVTGEDVRDIGHVILNKPLDPSQKYYIGDIKIVDENYRGKGYGLSTYLEVLKSLPAGRGLRTEGVLSDDSLRMWQGLVDRGVARRLHPDLAPAEFETVF